MTRLIVLLTLLMAGLAMAQEHGATPASQPGAAHHAGADAQPHPVLSHDSTWAGVMVIIVLGMFLAAMVIGPIVRVNMPEEPPPDAHHDDHADHGHGHDDAHGHGH